MVGGKFMWHRLQVHLPVRNEMKIIRLTNRTHNFSYCFLPYRYLMLAAAKKKRMNSTVQVGECIQGLLNLDDATQHEAINSSVFLDFFTFCCYHCYWSDSKAISEGFDCLPVTLLSFQEATL